MNFTALPYAIETPFTLRKLRSRETEKHLRYREDQVKGSVKMAKATDIKKKIVSAGLALLLAAGFAPVAAFADTPLAEILATSENSSSSFARTMHALIEKDALMVYAATARANGDEAEAAALEAEALGITAVVEDAADEAPAQEAVSEEAATSEEAVVLPSDTIQIGSAVIPFVNSYLTASAPADRAGLWWGESSTTDGDLGYFIGHNPGVFAPVVGLVAGDQATVTDDNGDARTYTVIDVFDVPNTATLQDIQSRISGHGESIVMQGCIEGGAYYRVVVAA